MTKDWQRALLGLVVSAILLGAMLWRTNFVAIWAQLRLVAFEWILFSFFFSVMVLLIRSARIKILVPAAAFDLCVSSVSVQQFLNRVTPLRLGELILPVYFKTFVGADMVRGLAQIVLIRLIDMVCIAISLSVALMFRVPENSPIPNSYVTAAACVLALLLVTMSWWASQMVLWLIKMFRQSSRLARFVVTLEKAEVTIRTGHLLSATQWGGLALLTILVLVGQTLLFHCLLASAGIWLSPHSLLLGSGVAQVGAAVPIASVGTFGTQEASWVAGYCWVGVSYTDALTTGILCQLVTLCFSAVFAAIGRLNIAWRWQRGSVGSIVPPPKPIA